MLSLNGSSDRPAPLPGLTKVLESAGRMEAILTGADLEVIIARCGFLTNQDETDYRAELGFLPPNGSRLRTCHYQQKQLTVLEDENLAYWFP